MREVVLVYDFTVTGSCLRLHLLDLLLLVKEGDQLFTANFLEAFAEDLVNRAAFLNNLLSKTCPLVHSLLVNLVLL